jgi:hypothetical protein
MHAGAEILEISHELLRKAFLWREARIHVSRRNARDVFGYR